MQVIFCNIPSKTSLGELVNFAQSGIRPILPFLRKPQIVAYEILDITDKRKLLNEFHGLVTYANKIDAEKAIKALNGKKLHGKPIPVRTYVYRKPGDGRVKQNTQGLNRPDNQRREELVIKKRSEVDADQPHVTAYDQSHTYGRR